MLHRVRLLTLVFAFLVPGLGRADEVDDLLKDLRAVGAEGAGASKARSAWGRLVRQGPKVLPRILVAMDTPDPVVANWLRLAFDAIAEADLVKGGKRIDVDALVAFAGELKRQGRARRLALELSERLRPGARKKFLAGKIDDPEFRFEAIEQVLDDIQQDKKQPGGRAAAALVRLFGSTRDLDQARTVAARLEERGVKVSVADHLGFLRDWWLIGPFDGNGRKGFATAHPPEKKVDLDATLEGKGGKKLRWKRETLTETRTGRFPILVDLRKPLGDADDAVAYAWTALEVPAARTVEFRGAADDNLSVWVNGVRVFGFEEYQNGVRLDRHRFEVKLSKGVNTILVKVCQDVANLAPNWEFLLRITDPTGRGIAFPVAKKTAVRGEVSPHLGARSPEVRRINVSADTSLPRPRVAAKQAPDDWSSWRGPGHDGLSPDRNPPLTWSATENVRWKAAIPGAGVSAPVVVGDRVYVTSSSGRSNEHLHLFCFHSDDGRVLWQRRFFGSEVSEGQFPPGGMAVPSPVASGKHVHALYGTGDLVCLDSDGNPVWVRSLAREYGVFRNRWGMASTPLLHEGTLFVQVDHWGKSYLLAIDAVTGRNRWRTLRDAAVNWTSPIVVRVGDRTLIVAVGTNSVKGYDAGTGQQVWSLGGQQTQCIPTPVARGDRLWLISGEEFTSQCLRLGEAGKSARLEWKMASKGTGIPSPVCLGEHLYYAEDAGWAVCVRADTGKQVWRRRLSGKVQASPVAAAGRLYFSGVNGTVTVLQAGAEFKVLARNEIGEGIVASPGLARGRLYVRGEKHLFCIGK